LDDGIGLRSDTFVQWSRRSSGTTLGACYRTVVVRIEPERDMHDTVDHDRRRFLGTAALTLAAARVGMIDRATTPSKAHPTMVPSRTRVPPTSFESLKQVDAGVLNVGYAESGPANGTAVILLHGWPYDIHAFEEVAPALAARGYRVIAPYLRGYGTTRFRSDSTFWNGEQAALGADVIALMDALDIRKAILAGFDWGSRTATIVAALWPERCRGLVAVSGYLVVNLEANQKPLPPRAELGWWYQYYFATERGVRGYTENRYDFNRLIWKLASPKWNFDDATFERTAESFGNPDHVAIVIHNYRWRLSLARGEPQYDTLEQRLFQAPVIGVPAITIASDFDGAAADGKAYAKMFTGRYSHRVLEGIGHNVPQEAPEAFAKAIVDVDHA
jgi:pimeloyl-ACP methyl ester carboxylesterase